MTSMRDFETDKDWDYVRSTGPGTKNVKKFIRFEPVGEGVYELVVLEGWPTKVRYRMLEIVIYPSNLRFAEMNGLIGTDESA